MILLKQLEFELRRVIKIGFLLLFLGSALTAIRDGNAATYTPKIDVAVPFLTNSVVDLHLADRSRF